MDLTREQALKLHKQMWGDMQKELGDTPNLWQRIDFKRDWIKRHGYIDEDGYTNIYDYCFLCEYAINERKRRRRDLPYRKCVLCPIDWSDLTPIKRSERYGYCVYLNHDGHQVWGVAPISKILALPERNI